MLYFLDRLDRQGYINLKFRRPLVIKSLQKHLPCLLAAAFAGTATTHAQLVDSAAWSIGRSVNKSFLANPGLDLPIVPNGQLTNSGWALARLNDGGSPVTASTYLFPETKVPVRLYLIDTAVNNSSGWFNSNPNLSITTELISYAGGPNTSSAFTHGTHMLGIIAGPETGVAQGTPIEVINYDIYPDGEDSATTSAALAVAVTKALFHQSFNPEIPAIICIAAGTPTPGSSAGLESKIEDAVSEGITVIVSAGNSSLPASGFVPSAYGTMDGVICIGASNQSNGRLAMSNYGNAVDIYAPGQDIRTVKVSSPSSGSYDTSTGTSPATAMATGAALAMLSMHPELTPAELEASLKSASYTGGVDLVQLPPIDSDGDGAHDVLEQFAGCDPLDASDAPARPNVWGSGQANGNTLMSIGFTINASEFNAGTPNQLSSGITWKIKETADMENWIDSTSGTLSFGTAVGGRIPVTYTRIGGESVCFLKLEITPAP
jgi:hypothetical protein